jgi:hypothetical protein
MCLLYETKRELKRIEHRVRLVLVVTEKVTRDLVRHTRNQRTCVHVIVRIVGVGRVELVCMMSVCPVGCLNEDHGNGEGVDFQEISRLSDTRRYSSVTGDSVKD